MRSIAKLALIIPVFLFMMNSASAAFFLNFNPTSPTTVNPGGSGTFQVVARYVDFGNGETSNFDNFSVVLNQSSSVFTLSTNNLTGSAGSFLVTPTKVLGTVTFTNTPPAPGSTTVFFGSATAAGSPTIGFLAPVAVTLTAVPEPSSFALLGAAGLGFAVYRSRRRSKAC